MPALGTGLASRLGGKTRREDPAGYYRIWREENRAKNNEYNRNYYHTVTKQDPVKQAKRHASGTWSRRKAKYGITKGEYERLLTCQDGRCIICNEHYGDDLKVDHDHATGKVRALLCANCNSGLGLFKEDPNRMLAAADYIKRHTKGD